jgi:Protein of unknown function (DUF4240)
MAMDESKFWSIIADAREENDLLEGEDADLYNVLYLTLEELPESDVAEFQQQMLIQYCKAFDYALIGAAYVIIGPQCDEDDQHGFRGWLIAQGEEFFKKTLNNPDSLADEDIVRHLIYLPEIINVGSEVYEELTGELPPADPTFVLPAEPVGVEFKPNELPTRLPNLCFEWGFESDEQIEADSVDPVSAILASVDAQIQAADQPESDEKSQG